MEYNKNGHHESFKEFHLTNGVVIGIFQGDRGQNPDFDIVIKYKEPGKRIRTPKHIHWTIDLLIKKQHAHDLTLKFVRYLRAMYDQIEPFRTKSEQQACNLKFTTNEKLREFEPLNQYGEYSVEFIGHIIELMMIMEKTGMEGAFMFKDLMDTIIQEKDIFSIVSQATHNGR